MGHNVYSLGENVTDYIKFTMESKLVANMLHRYTVYCRTSIKTIILLPSNSPFKLRNKISPT
jgi:hypothetical protein